MKNFMMILLVVGSMGLVSCAHYGNKDCKSGKCRTDKSCCKDESEKKACCDKEKKKEEMACCKKAREAKTECTRCASPGTGTDA